mgnify:FL=1
MRRLATLGSCFIGSISILPAGGHLFMLLPPGLLVSRPAALAHRVAGRSPSSSSEARFASSRMFIWAIRSAGLMMYRGSGRKGERSGRGGGEFGSALRGDLGRGVGAECGDEGERRIEVRRRGWRSGETVVGASATRYTKSIRQFVRCWRGFRESVSTEVGIGD